MVRMARAVCDRAQPPRGPFGQSLRAAVIVLAPVGVTLVLAAWVHMAPGSRWPGLAVGIWLLAQLVVVPACWAAARRDFER